MAARFVVRKAKPHQRYYLKSGDRVPGVTTILGVINKPALVPWANNLGLQGIKSSEYVDDLADIGTLAHHLIQCHLTGGSPDISDYTPNQMVLAENVVASFHGWARGKAIETRQTEWPLVFETHRYGGTVDWYGRINGRHVLLDFKTGSSIYNDHLYQVAGYHRLLVESGYEVDEVRVLQVGRSDDEGFSEKVIPGHAINPYWEVFRAARLLKDAIDATRKRRGR